jgi:hypothetical protein
VAVVTQGFALGWDMAAPLALSEGEAEVTATAGFLREWKKERQEQQQQQRPIQGSFASL